MKHSIYNYSHAKGGLLNIGDHIQSLAAKQFLPSVDFYVDRDKPNLDYDKSKIIMNGWHTFGPQNYPPSKNLLPLLISYHLNPFYADKILSRKECRDFFIQNGPVGCRDYTTLEIFKKYNIDAYYSFCLTTTLGYSYSSKIKTNEIIINDPFYEFNQSHLYKASPARLAYHFLTGKTKTSLNLKKQSDLLNIAIPNHIQHNAIRTNHYVKFKNNNTDLMYEKAETLLKRYARAKCVVTSRIHCALPSLSMGTPVYFLFDGLSDQINHLSRLKGTIDHLNLLTTIPKDKIETLFDRNMNVIHPEEVNWDQPHENPKSFKPFSDKLIQSCKKFIN